MKVLMCGDRNWVNSEAIRFELANLPLDTIIIHGGARGADTIAGQEAILLGFEVIAVHANWHKYGKAAGPIRNADMLKLKPDIVIAFHSNITSSKGTKDMVTRARKAGIPTKLVEI